MLIFVLERKETNKQHEILENAQKFTLTFSTPEKYPINAYIWYFLNLTKKFYNFIC